MQVQAHKDGLEGLGEPGSLPERLKLLHQQLQTRYPQIHRMAVALYDDTTGRARTFIQSTRGESPLCLYEIPLEEAPDLKRLLDSREGRVVEDLSVFAQGTHAHTRAIREGGFASSYTLPFFWQGHPEAFIFFNSREPGAFPEPCLDELDLWAHLVGMLVVAERASLKALLAALRTANQMVHLRDPETGGHLERMAAFSRLIAREMARRGLHPFDDATIETLACFAPMHDVGKIGIPDSVLMKAGRLTDQETQVMQRHPALGGELVSAILQAFGADRLEHVELLRQVTEGHHEMLDGSGYPEGLKGQQIPMAARIIAVADVFDALTSRRPYKEPWSNGEAFAYLQRQATDHLDRDCVEVLIALEPEVLRIQAEFLEPQGKP